jgi:catechol 2,3-dioxygenase-like lactoylglutathione lyase family enzyme
MNSPSILGSSKLIAFAITTNPARTIEFYGGKLGLRFMSQDNFAVVFDCNGNMLRMAIAKEYTPPKYTVVGWQVSHIEAVVADLIKAGVKFNHYGFPTQDEQGIWTTPDGNKVAWFEDPDGNVLSVSQHD